MATEEKAANLPRSFKDLLQESDRPVLVDFWAEWCGPCRMVAPVIEQIAREYKGKLRVVKVNIDEKPHIASQYGIQSIPTIMLFDKGRAVMHKTGALPYNALTAEVDRALKEVS